MQIHWRKFYHVLYSRLLGNDKTFLLRIIKHISSRKLFDKNPEHVTCLINHVDYMVFLRTSNH
jgi:hypothetical protein